MKNAISTCNFVGDNLGLSIKYPNRKKACVSCSKIYFVSLKKTISKSKFCCRTCSDVNQKRGYWNRGKVVSKENRVKLSILKSGDKSPLWKGGVSKTNQKIRAGLEYRLWRESVFKRDDWKCIKCGYKGYVEADHIKSFAYYPELRFDVSNGRTLCKKCHKLTSNYAFKARKIYEASHF